MNFTDHNIDNPFKTNQLLMRDEVHNAMYLFQAEYDAIGIKDPKCFYIIKDRCAVYHGNEELLTPSYNHKIAGKYFISNNDQGEFVIYLNYETYDHRVFLIEIERYDNSAKAMERMMLYNKTKSHCKRTMDLLYSIQNFIDRKTSLIDFMYEIFTIFGYKNHPEFQNLIHSVKFYWGPAKQYEYKIPNAMLARERELCASKNFLFKKFFALYYLIASYNLFHLKKKITKDEIMNMIEKIYLIF